MMRSVHVLLKSKVGKTQDGKGNAGCYKDLKDRIRICLNGSSQGGDLANYQKGFQNSDKGLESKGEKATSWSGTGGDAENLF